MGKRTKAKEVAHNETWGPTKPKMFCLLDLSVNQRGGEWGILKNIKDSPVARRGGRERSDRFTFIRGNLMLLVIWSAFGLEPQVTKRL